jgi:hypothetical protein
VNRPPSTNTDLAPPPGARTYADAAAVSMTAVLYAPTEDDEAAAADWARVLRWRVVAAVRDPSRVAAAMRLKGAGIVVTTVEALAGIGREATGRLNQQVSEAGGELHAGVVGGRPARAAVARRPTVVAPTNLLPGAS